MDPGLVIGEGDGRSRWSRWDGRFEVCCKFLKFGEGEFGGVASQFGVGFEDGEPYALEVLRLSSWGGFNEGFPSCGWAVVVGFVSFFVGPARVEKGGPFIFESFILESFVL